MAQLIWFFLPMILLLGGITSYTDIKYGKIRNKWVLAGLLYGIILMSIIFSIYQFTNTTPTLTLEGSDDEIPFFQETLLNFIIAIVIGILLWINNVWSAADSKLFMAFALLTPITVYKFGYVRLFPSFVIIINAFFFIFLITLFQLLKGGRKDIWRTMKKFVKDPKSIAVSAALIFLIEWVFFFFFEMIGIEQTVLSLLLLLLIVIKIFGTIMDKINSKNQLILVGLVLLRIFFDTTVHSWQYVTKFAIILFLFVFVRLFLQKLASRSFSYRVPIPKLKEGMILAKSLVKPFNKKKYTFMNEREKNKTRVNTIVHPSAEGLTKEEIKEIKKAYKENKILDKNAYILAHTCFGPYIFAGTLIAILFKGNILMVLTYLIYNIQ